MPASTHGGTTPSRSSAAALRASRRFASFVATSSPKLAERGGGDRGVLDFERLDHAERHAPQEALPPLVAMRPHQLAPLAHRAAARRPVARSRGAAPPRSDRSASASAPCRLPGVVSRSQWAVRCWKKASAWAKSLGKVARCGNSSAESSAATWRSRSSASRLVVAVRGARRKLFMPSRRIWNSRRQTVFVGVEGGGIAGGEEGEIALVVARLALGGLVVEAGQDGIARAEAVAGAAIALEVGMPLHPPRLDEALHLAGVEGGGEAALPVDVQVEARGRHRLEGAERAHVLRLLVVQQLGAYPGQRRLHRAAARRLRGCGGRSCAVRRTAPARSPCAPRRP